MAGYEDLNNAERLRVDPTMRTVIGGRAKDHTAASTSEIARFETETLSSPTNLERLTDVSGQWIDHALRHRKLTRLVFDVLERTIARLLKRPVGRPSKKPKVFYHSFRYRAKSWDRDRQVAAKVEWHAGDRFPRGRFAVTNVRRSPKRFVKF